MNYKNVLLICFFILYSAAAFGDFEWKITFNSKEEQQLFHQNLDWWMRAIGITVVTVLGSVILFLCGREAILPKEIKDTKKKK